MKEVVVERALRAEPARALQRIEQGLMPLGYAAAARSSLELSFVGGPASGRHRLTVRADGQRVFFAFAQGSPGVVLPALEALERVVNAALGEVAPVAAGGDRRCSICSTVVAPGDTHCPTCGMAV